MSGELDAAGTAIEGAMLGTAVEPATGNPAASAIGGCLNCGAVLGGAYCAACGQKANIHRTLSAIWHDILHSALHFDGKMWRTLPMLLFKPGELTRRYIHGERAKFVSPMALFLFSIFLMFAVFSFTGGANRPVDNNWMQVSIAKLDGEIAVAEKQLAGPPPLTGAERTGIEERLKELKSDRNGLAYATSGTPVYDDVGARIKAGDKRSLTFTKAETGSPWLNNLLNKGAIKMLSNPSLTFYKLQSNGYKFAWLLIPLSLPFVWLVTLGISGHQFYDHAVFATYSIAFMSLLFIVSALLGRTAVGDDLAMLLLFIIPPIHIYKQMRHSYNLTRTGGVIRTILLLLCIVIILAFFAMTLLFLGLLG
ncbi:MAG: DUF3667 domain-containing protein [Sphingomonadales bacterium]|jgi:hypothetical protein|nr:DUF3667 domain-containing protein [Sphingomonadales bacterium]MBK9004416.1 DUF3667 domain-containing protein [Sphingomonadales bacterium]MBK9269601.1 DUF3667 domain-containing protein [Sphingomonadales bacterium]MBP6434208.1 DUF3667 domain-containing protein [Sphingorhabdus sp.]